MEEKLLQILEKMKEIEYGWVDKYGVVHKSSKRDFFIQNYRLQKLEDTLKYKVGTCWEQVELVRFYLEKENIPVKTYIVIYNEEGRIARHTIAVAEVDGKFYWMENSWNLDEFKIKYDSTDEILNELVGRFPRMYKIPDFDKNRIEIYEYEKPEEGLSFEEFTDWCRKGVKYGN